MNLFFVGAVPIAVILGIWAVSEYLRLRRPSALALGSAFPKLCVVSSDEIQSYFEDSNQGNYGGDHLRRETALQRSKVARRYVGQMAANTRLFQQVTRFEKLKIDPHKSSLEYETRETLILRLVDESSDVRWLLVKAQASLALRSCVGGTISVRTMRRILGQYKQLEQDFVALVGMASDDVYYTMLVERLGLSNWRLLEGGSSETPAS
jgi:hypothetical protein